MYNRYSQPRNTGWSNGAALINASFRKHVHCCTWSKLTLLYFSLLCAP